MEHYKILNIDTKSLQPLVNEILKLKLLLPFIPISPSKQGLKLNNTIDREVLKNSFSVINSCTELNFISPSSLGIELNLENPLLWTYPQIRIDCEANRTFKAPLHQDKHILGSETKGFVIWLPISTDGSRINGVIEYENLKYVKNEYWGVECKASILEEKEIHLNFGQALVFDESFLHYSNPLPNGQLTLQLRYFEASEHDFEKRITQKINDQVLIYQDSLFK